MDNNDVIRHGCLLGLTIGATDIFLYHHCWLFHDEGKQRLFQALTLCYKGSVCPFMWQPASLQAETTTTKKKYCLSFSPGKMGYNEIWRNNLMRISAIQIKYDIGGWKESKEHWGESWQADTDRAGELWFTWNSCLDVLTGKLENFQTHNGIFKPLG